MGKTNVLGLVNECVLVQEYLEGEEYVVDMVSREGEHKVVGGVGLRQAPSQRGRTSCVSGRSS